MFVSVFEVTLIALMMTRTTVLLSVYLFVYCRCEGHWGEKGGGTGGREGGMEFRRKIEGKKGVGWNEGRESEGV